MRFSDIPYEQHPFNFERYGRLFDELQAAYQGCGGYDTEVGAALIRAALALNDAWAVLQARERAEQEEPALGMPACRAAAGGCPHVQ